MNHFIKIEIEISSDEQSDIMMSELSDINYYAFEQEEKKLIAYIKEVDFDEEKLKEVLVDDKSFKKTIIEAEDWNQQWESGLQPVIIKDFVAIRAAFHQPVENVKHNLIITPKMSFGTGHHATTFLMITLMEKIDFRNKTVLDFGTGTGVLAILAEKEGASKVVAVDYDEWSINNVNENILANGCENILVKKTNTISGMDQADIILANINLNIITESSSPISAILPTGGLLLTSGFLSKDEPAMEILFTEKYFVKESIFQKEGWLAMLFRKL
ncbi:MAG: 50S ribosomal protein L11 methyltransferase [Ginsengibacter sp.]